MEYFGRANWSKFVTEYGTVKEGKDLYELENEMKKQIGQNRVTKFATTQKQAKTSTKSKNKDLSSDKILRLAEIEKSHNMQTETTDVQEIAKIAENASAKITDIKEKYPIKEDGKVEASNIESTLKETIKFVENITDEDILDDIKVSLYKVDMDLIKLDIKNEYVINIRTGELYKLKGVKYKGKTYHRPDWGVTKSGEVEKPPKEIPEDTEETIYLYLGIPNYKEKQLTTKLTEGEVEWSTSDESVATIEKDGERTAKVTGIAKGEAIVTISYKTEDTGEDTTTDDENGGMTEGEEEVTVVTTQKYKIIVEDGIPENFTIELEDKTINEYEESRLEAKIEGVAVGTSYLEWESSDESKVKVDINGKITGVEKGEAIITCKWKSNEAITATCKVTVKENEKLILDKTKMNITINQRAQIIAKNKDTNVTNVAQWRSENDNIATVDAKGKIQAIGLGTTKVMAEYLGQTAICEVTVKDYVEEIYTIEDLSLFATQVNTGNKFEGKTVKVMNDLNFKDESSYESTSSTEYTDYYTNTKTWVRIGTSTSNYFAGTFNGNGKTITNLNINATAANQGLFGYSKGGIFKSLILKDVNITSTSYNVGSVLGNGVNVTISNCKVSGTISSTGQVSNHNKTGGIVGLIGTAGGTITNCINEATIGGSYQMKGGIVGLIDKGRITNCINKGSITSANAYLGGIAGSAGWKGNENYNVMIDNCNNYGEINGKCYIGGIVGLIRQGSSVTNCTNYKTATINATGYNSSTYYDSDVGGIIGNIFGDGNNRVENCNNYADISGKYNAVGGIVGTSMKATIINCKNEGTITGERYYTAGINGRTGYYSTNRKIYTKSTIENCINKGKVTSSGPTTGGITGQNNYGSEIKNSSNYGDVTGTGKDSNSQGIVGGIVGGQSTFGSIGSIVENCNNHGNIKASYYYCGGIIGWQQKGSVKHCINTGSITNERANTGGITGATGVYNDSIKSNGTLEECINKGNVTMNGTGASCHNVGGITGYIQYGSSITMCGNTGDIIANGYYTTADKASRMGGIVGTMQAHGVNTVTYCYNTGNVTGSYKCIGGIVGILNLNTGVIDHCYSTGITSGPANIGGIVGYNKGTVTNSYYLENSVQPTTGTITEQGTSASQSTIKSIINLNIWKDYFKTDKTPNINKGFPILKWQ